MCIKNNGFISEVFNSFRGIRQGCPCSCLIYILCAEVLAQAIRQNENLKGIKLDRSYITIAQYADDATVFLQNEYELDLCIKEIEKYGKVSDTSLNINKCEGMWIGKSRDLQKDCKIGKIR